MSEGPDTPIFGPPGRSISPCGKMINDCQITTYEIRRRSAEDQTYMSGTHFGARLIAEAGRTGLSANTSYSRPRRSLPQPHLPYLHAFRVSNQDSITL